MLHEIVIFVFCPIGYIKGITVAPAQKSL